MGPAHDHAAEPGRDTGPRPAHVPSPAGHAVHRPDAHRPLAVATLPALQRAAGNHAVAAMLGAPGVQRQETPAGPPTLDEQYREALRTADQTGDYGEAAMLLNGFSREDITQRLAALDEQQIAYLHLGAVNHPGVGPGSQVAQMTGPGAPRASTAGPVSSQAPGAPAPAPAGARTGLTPEAIAAMSATDRLVEAFQRARIPAAMRERILAVMTPEALVAAVVSFVVAFAVSQLTPVGWAADFALALTVVFVGMSLVRAAEHLIAFAEARNATTEEQLDHAGQEFARAVAEIGVDAVLFLITRKMAPAAGAGGAPPPPAGGVVLVTTQGQLVVVAVDAVPVAIASQAGIAGGALMSAAAGGGGGGEDDDFDDFDPEADYWERKFRGSRQKELPKRTRISDANKQELQESGWLRSRMPSVERRRQFMDWLEERHHWREGIEHGHVKPGSPGAEEALREFLLDNP
ncbi:MAG: hypothetical protein ACOC84_04450 [Actinomycetota bacterium]